MRRRLLILSAVIIVAAGGAGALYWWSGGPEEAVEDPPEVDRPIYEVGSITTDLSAGAEGRRSWVQMDLQLQCRDRDALRAVEENWVQIRNEVLATLRSSGPEDLKGEAGMQRLRQQIIERANAILDEAEVTDVFFVKMIVQ